MAVRKRQTPFGRRAMAALVWGVGAFVGIQALLVAGMEFWRPQLRDLEFGLKLNFLEQRLADEPEQPLLMMFGSSRTLLAFQADGLEGLCDRDGRPLTPFNFGITGAGPLKQWVTLRTLLDRDIQPRRLLLEIMPPLLNESGPQRMSEEQWLVIGRLGATDILRLTKYHSRRQRLGWHWLTSHLVPCYYQRFSILGDVDEGWLPPEPHLRVIFQMAPTGWIPGATEVFHASKRRQYEEAEKQEYARAFNDYRVGAGARQALCDLLDTCRDRQIEVALVLMPEARSFRAMYTAQADAELQRLLTDMRQVYGIEHIDARLWVPEDEFFDSHHVMPTGAATFTGQLRQELEKRPEIWNQPRRCPGCP